MQPNVPVIPPAQSVFVYTMIGLVLLAFVCMLVLKVSIWLAEKRAGVEYRWESPEAREVGPIRGWIESHARTVEARYTPRRYLAMSSDGEEEGERIAPVAPAVTTSTAALSPIVTPNNEYSSGLSDSGRIQFEATAKTLATLYEAGVITNISKAICKAYGCSVQSATKTDSTYQMALKAVNRYLPKSNAPQFRITPEQEQAREALGLNRPS